MASSDDGKDRSPNECLIFSDTRVAIGDPNLSNCFFKCFSCLYWNSTLKMADTEVMKERPEAEPGCGAEGAEEIDPS